MTTNELALQMKSDAVIERFADVTGSKQDAHVFIASVLLAVKDNNALESCTSTSVIKSALRAATLRVSVDPALKQAYLVPYGGNATLQLGWKGLYDMAMRTGKYRFINVAEIKPGFTVDFDLISGAAKVAREEGSEGGWVASFELASKWGGMGKSLFMTHSEIQAHKEKYAKGHNRKDSAWNTALLQMERKTVLRNLLQTWGVFDDEDMAVLAEIEAEIEGVGEDVFDIEPMTAEEMIAAEIAADSGEEKEPMTEQEILSGLGYGEE